MGIDISYNDRLAKLREKKEQLKKSKLLETVRKQSNNKSTTPLRFRGGVTPTNPGANESFMESIGGNDVIYHQGGTTGQI